MSSTDGMSFTKTGFHFPDISLVDNDFADSLNFELQGFQLQPVGFRLSSFDFNWFDPLSSEVKLEFCFRF